jgi:sulfite reductase alpha subunit-like flavoprotein
MLQLGAHLLCEPGYGDDGTPQGGVFADLDVWLEQVLLVQFATTNPTSQQEMGYNPYRLSLLSSTTCEQLDEEWQHETFQESYQSFFQSVSPMMSYSYDNVERKLVPEQTRPRVAVVESNQRLTTEDWEQDTRHIRFQVPSFPKPKEWSLSALPYQAGDIACILPSNSAKEVDRFLRVLPKSIQDVADVELYIAFDATDNTVSTIGISYPHWPTHCTLRGWLTYCADIHAIPEREDLRALSFYCSLEHPFGAEQRDKLLSLSETRGSALYADYCLREKRSWADVIYDFDSLRAQGSLLTLEALLALLSPIRPREFSIASSPTEEWKKEESAIELCVARVQGTTPLGRNYHGLCSDYLATLSRHGSIVRLWVRPGSFHQLPVSGPRPVLCIGAGTGIAPLRGLVRERRALGCHNDILVFGCRKESCDYYYKNEWWPELKQLTAFSRDQWHKVYVQQVLQKAELEHQLLSQHVLHQDGAIYVAGSPRMAKAVKEVLAESLVAVLGDEKQVQLFLAQRQATGLLSVEAWG